MADVTGSLTLRSRGVAEAGQGSITASLPSGSTRIFLDAAPTGWDDDEFPKAIQFEAYPFLGYLISASGTVAEGEGPISGPFIDLHYPVTSEIPAGSKWYLVNLCATENFTLVFDVETLTRSRDNGVGYVRVTASPGPEHEGGHVAGLVGETPILSWFAAGIAAFTDLRTANPVLNITAGGFSPGDNIRIGSEANTYTVEEVGAGSITLNRPIRPRLFGTVSATTDFYSTSTTNDFSGNTGTSAPTNPHDHDMTHAHYLPSYETVIPFDNATGAAISTGSYVEIRGSIYRVSSYSSSTITIDGGLSGPVFDDDEIYAMSIPGGLAITSNLWQHRGTIQMPPIEYSGHIIITTQIDLFQNEALAVGAGTPLDSKIYKFGRPTPISTVRKISDTVYEMQDRTLAPGNLVLYGYGITNKWGTQTLNAESPGVEFTQPSELGNKAGI